MPHSRPVNADQFLYLAQDIQSRSSDCHLRQLLAYLEERELTSSITDVLSHTESDQNIEAITCKKNLTPFRLPCFLHQRPTLDIQVWQNLPHLDGIEPGKYPAD